jgi:hypothetical protein
MNAQTRSVLKATLIGLAISVVVTTIGVLSEGRLDPIDPYQIFNAGVVGHWVGRVGFFPLIFAIGAIALSIRKTPIWISLLNLIGAVVSISLVVAIGVVVAAAAYPVSERPFASGAERDNFIKSGMASCIRTQRGRPDNKGVSDDAINAFCSCYVNADADATTREDVQYQAKYGTMSADAKNKLTAAYNKCVPVTR